MPFFAALAALAVGTVLLDKGDVWAGIGLIAAVLSIEAALVVRHRLQPERTPTVGLAEGVYTIDEGHFVGQQAVHVPPHWLGMLAEGQFARVRVAHPPGEPVAVVLGIEGRTSADFERSRGLTPAPVAPPLVGLLLTTAGLLVAGAVLVGGGMFVVGDTAMGDAWPVFSAVAHGEVTASSADVAEHGLPDAGILAISDATVLPRELVEGGPPDAAWAILSPQGRDRLVAEREAEHGRKLGGIPKPDESSNPARLHSNDVLAWRRADLHETFGPTGRPGDQVMVWLARRRTFVAVKTTADTDGLLRGRVRSEQVAFALGCVVLGLLALPVLLLTLLSNLARGSARKTFDKRVQSTYGGA